MSKKLKLNPRVAYFMGLYSTGKDKAVGITSEDGEVIAKFVKIAIDEFEVEPNKILFEQRGRAQRAYFYNSKLKKLLDNALERKSVTFKYKNDYAAGYVAGLFDIDGGKDGRGLFIKDYDDTDFLLIENLGFHTMAHGNKLYIKNARTFLDFIKKFTGRFE